MEDPKVVLNSMNTNMMNEINEIHTAIRLQTKGYQKLKCPQCDSFVQINKDSHYQGTLFVTCHCGLLNLVERGI